MLVRPHFGDRTPEYLERSLSGMETENVLSPGRLQRIRVRHQPADRIHPVSPAEYWSFLSVAMLLAVAFLVPVRFGAKRHTPDHARGAMPCSRRSTDEPHILQHGRARESGRGRQADAPWQIPLRGWKDVLWRTYQQIGEDRLLAVAAGVVFYGMLALFPATTALVSLYGLFADATSISDRLASLNGILPSSTVDIVREQISHLTSHSNTKLGFGFVVGLGIALWSANAGMKAIMDALNVAYEEKEKRGFIKLNLLSLAFTIAAVVSVLLSLGGCCGSAVASGRAGAVCHHLRFISVCALAS